MMHADAYHLQTCTLRRSFVEYKSAAEILMPVLFIPIIPKLMVTLATRSVMILQEPKVAIK